MIPASFSTSDFSADFFTLDQMNRPTDGNQFLEGLHVLTSRALDALSTPEDVELAFQRIKNANLVELSPQDKTNVDQQIQDVFVQWVKVTFGSHSRYVPRERLTKQCGPKFRAQYTSLMKEATDQELDLQSGDPSPTDGCPEDCKELLLVYLQTGALPPGALGDNTLNILVLAKQHQMEGLTQECLDFLIDNLSHENLGTFLEFTQQTPLPRLELACLNFMKDNRNSISKKLKTKYQEELSVVEALARGKITLTISSSGKIEAEVETFTDQTADVLQKINNRFPIASLILPKEDQNNLFICLKQMAPNLKHLQELVIWNKAPTDDDLPKLKRLFPNLTALGNDAPFLSTFDKVKTYVKNFRNPGENGQESKKPLLRSLNLRAVPNLTDAQLAELTPYLQELYHLFIISDKITSVVAPKAASVECWDCTKLTTLEAPRATSVNCGNCTKLTTLETPRATSVNCGNCTKLTTLETLNATTVNCDRCTALTTLKAPEATWVDCERCTALTTLEAPEANAVICTGCTALTTLEAPKAPWVDCDCCTALTTLKAPKATTVFCGHCTALATLEMPEAMSFNCKGCTKFTTLRTPDATTVNCTGCTKLTTLEAPKAILVLSEGCTQLTTLEAPKATEVHCNGCTQLTTLEAPKATEVHCNGCTALTTLKAPKATSVSCDGCTALTTLEAPKTTKVNYYGFTKLTTLEEPEATEVDCSGRKALTTLEEPEATEVDGSGRNALTTLEEPEATEVDGSGRKALTTSEAPEANFVDEPTYTPLIRVFINSLWAFFAYGCRSFLSLFDNLKNYFQNTLDTR